MVHSFSITGNLKITGYSPSSCCKQKLIRKIELFVLWGAQIIVVLSVFSMYKYIIQFLKCKTVYNYALDLNFNTRVSGLCTLRHKKATLLYSAHTVEQYKKYFTLILSCFDVLLIKCKHDYD